jgi:hypothetical protein
VLRAVPQPPAAQLVPRSALALTYSHCYKLVYAGFGIRQGNVTDVWCS